MSDEIVIRIKKNEYPSVYERFLNAVHYEKYLNYIVNLDNVVNGRYSENERIIPADNYYEDYKKGNLFEILTNVKETIEGLNIMFNKIDSITPEEFKNRQLNNEGQLKCRPKEDIVHHLLIVKEQLEAEIDGILESLDKRFISGLKYAFKTVEPDKHPVDENYESSVAEIARIIETVHGQLSFDDRFNITHILKFKDKLDDDKVKQILALVSDYIMKD